MYGIGGAVASCFLNQPPAISGGPTYIHNYELVKIIQNLNNLVCGYLNLSFRKGDGDVIDMVMYWKDYGYFHSFYNYEDEKLLEKAIEVYNDKIKEWQILDKYRIRCKE